jgi:hypothetical protein
MEIQGEFEIPAARQQVWEALNDPEVLKQCVPGCQEIEKISDTEFVAKATLKIGPVKASFRGKVTLSDLDPPNGYKISGEGQGGVAGFARGEADVRLDDRNGATVLNYAAKATVGGKLAQVGQRLLDTTARKLADEFFGKFSEVVGTAPAMAAAQVVEPPAAAPAGGIAPWTWVIGVLVVVSLLLVIFGL